MFFGSARLKSTKVAKAELKNATKNINPQKKKQLELLTQKKIELDDIKSLINFSGDYKSDIITSINAGVDIVILPIKKKKRFQPFENFVS